MKKITFLLISILIVLLTGCSDPIEQEKNQMNINGKIYLYDKKLINAIDKTRWINIKRPPTVKTIKPEREPQYVISIKGELFTLWDDGNNYLIDIKKGKENYWLALEGNEYSRAKKETNRYKDVEVEYPLTIHDLESNISLKYKESVVSPIEGTFNIPGFEQERYCYVTNTECIYFYQGNSIDDSKLIKDKLENKLALINMVSVPKIYRIKNITLMYVPNKGIEYQMERDILDALEKLK